MKPARPWGSRAATSVSPEVDKRLSESKDKPPRLKPEEWTSGDIVRVIEVVGRKDAVGPLLAEFEQKVRSGEKGATEA